MDFVLAFPQANIEFNMYMEITQVIETKYGSRTTHVLNPLKNLYGRRQEYRVRNQNLSKGLEEIWLRLSRVNNCVFYWNKFIFIVYVDNIIFSSPSNAVINQVTTDIRANFDCEDQGTL